MRIEKSVFRYIEHELYNYNDTVKELKLYREQILHGTTKPEVAVQSNLADTTANKAVKLSSSAFVIQSEKVINAIDRGMGLLGEKHRIIFELKYQNCMPWQEVMLEMNISDRTYFRLRRQLVLTVGQQMGLINV